jgi:host factor-I protein
VGEPGREGGFQRRGADGVAVSAKCDDTNGEYAFGIGIGRNVRGCIALPARSVPARPFLLFPLTGPPLATANRARSPKLCSTPIFQRPWRTAEIARQPQKALNGLRAPHPGEKQKDPAMDKKQNLQDTFLNAVRKSKTPLTIFLMNGVKLQGVVTWFDNFCVLLRRDGQIQLVYKHAISTIMPGGPVQLFDGDKSLEEADV